MKRSSRLLLLTLSPLVFILFLASCTSAGASQSQSIDPSVTPTLEPSTSPTQTLAPEPTFTATVEPTKSPSQFAAGLEGLNQERTYVVRGGYLVDTYNQAPKAVLQEDGTWRALDYENPEDAETMYGHLVPMPGDGYVDPRGYIHYWDNPRGIKDWQGINAVFLGDIDMELQTLPDGTKVDVPYFRIGLRDDASGNRLHVAQLVYDAIGFDPPHWTPGTSCQAAATGESSNIFAPVYPPLTIEELMSSDMLRPGMLLDITVWTAEMGDYDQMYFVKYSEKWPLSNNAAQQVSGLLLEMNQGQSRLTEEEWGSLAKESVWPDRRIRLYDFGIRWVDPVCANNGN